MTSNLRTYRLGFPQIHSRSEFWPDLEVELLSYAYFFFCATDTVDSLHFQILSGAEHGMKFNVFLDMCIDREVAANKKSHWQWVMLKGWSRFKCGLRTGAFRRQLLPLSRHTPTRSRFYPFASLSVFLHWFNWLLFSETRNLNLQTSVCVQHFKCFMAMARNPTLVVAAGFGAGTEKAFKTTVEIDRLIDNLRSTEYQNVSKYSIYCRGIGVCNYANWRVHLNTYIWTCFSLGCYYCKTPAWKVNYQALGNLCSPFYWLFY